MGHIICQAQCDALPHLALKKKTPQENRYYLHVTVKDFYGQTSAGVEFKPKQFQSRVRLTTLLDCENYRHTRAVANLAHFLVGRQNACPHSLSAHEAVLVPSSLAPRTFWARA